MYKIYDTGNFRRKHNGILNVKVKKWYIIYYKGQFQQCYQNSGGERLYYTCYCKIHGFVCPWVDTSINGASDIHKMRKPFKRENNTCWRDFIWQKALLPWEIKWNCMCLDKVEIDLDVLDVKKENEYTNVRFIYLFGRKIWCFNYRWREDCIHRSIAWDNCIFSFVHACFKCQTM